MSSENGGVSIDIKHGDSPEGEWYKVPDAMFLDPSEIDFTKQDIDDTLEPSDDFAKISVQNHVITLQCTVTCTICTSDSKL